MPAHSATKDCFPPAYLRSLKRQIRASPYFATHTLNRDFVQTKGFSLAFRSDGRSAVARAFAFFEPYLARTLRADCNAFYLNPLCLERGSRVDPHVDRSLRSYCKEVPTPVCVSVLYVEVPAELRGGALVLARGRKHLARIVPEPNMLVVFEGDLTHSIERLDCEGTRLSLVCEQYSLLPEELQLVPSFAIESRARTYA